MTRRKLVIPGRIAIPQVEPSASELSVKTARLDFSKLVLFSNSTLDGRRYCRLSAPMLYVIGQEPDFSEVNAALEVLDSPEKLKQCSAIKTLLKPFLREIPKIDIEELGKVRRFVLSRLINGGHKQTADALEAYWAMTGL